MSDIVQNKSKKLNLYLWTEFYRPESVKNILLPQAYKNFFKGVVESKNLPNLLLYSSTPGVGKTTLAKALCKDLNMDYIYINTSAENGIDTLRSIISKFATVKSLAGGLKAIILDEFDGATPALQQGLRAAIEEHHKTCRFIFTANYITKIINPLRSRCQEFDFNMMETEIVEEMKPKIFERLKGVLQLEEISFSEETIKQMVDTFYPDIRKMLGLLQQYSRMSNGKIDDNIFNVDVIDQEFFDLIFAHKLTAARNFLIQRSFNYDEVFRSFFDNLVPRLEKRFQAKAIVLINDYQYKNAFVVDKEINCTAMMVELMEFIPKK